MGLLLAALILYLATLDNGLRPGELAGGDLITHQYAQVQGRPGNAPGYPLYTMGGWLWFHVLRSLLGHAVNPTALLSSYSMLWALIALGLLYALIWRLTRNWLLAWLLGAFYAVSYFFWYYAVSSEQYTSAVAQTLTIVLVALHWDDQQDAADAATDTTPRGDSLLLLLALLCGLSLAHMITVVVIVPPLLGFILYRRPGLLRRQRLVVRTLALAALPLLSYAFIYIRGAQHPEWRGAGEWPNTWVWFLDFISTSQGRSELTWSLSPLFVNEFPQLIGQELTPVVLLGGLIGIGLLGRRRGSFFGITLLLYGLLAFIDRQGNWYQVIMPAYALLVASFAVTVQAVWHRAESRHWLTALLVLGLVLLIAVRWQRSWPATNLHNRADDTALLAGQAILADAPAPAAAIFATSEEADSLRYLVKIVGQRPDVTPVDGPAARTVLAEGQRPLYSTRQAAPLLNQEISSTLHLSAAGETLIRLEVQPVLSLPASAQVLDRLVGDWLALAGIEMLPTRADGLWRIRLYWRADAAIGYNWSTSLRPTQRGELITQVDGSLVLQDHSAPVYGMYPTQHWMKGEVVADDYALALPSGVSPDGVQIVIYRALPNGGFDNLAVLDVPLPTR